MAMVAAAAVIVLPLAPASAATVYDWTISGGDSNNGGDGTLSGSGTITLSSTPTNNGNGTGYLVTAITGSLSSANFSHTDNFSSSIASLWGPNGDVDDLVYPANTAVVDDFGLAVTLANGYLVGIGPVNSSPGYYNVNCCGGNGYPNLSYSDVTLTGSPASAVPEPSVWAMITLGLGALGFAARKQRRLRLA